MSWSTWEANWGSNMVSIDSACWVTSIDVDFGQLWAFLGEYRPLYSPSPYIGLGTRESTFPGRIEFFFPHIYIYIYIYIWGKIYSMRPAPGYRDLYRGYGEPCIPKHDFYRRNLMSCVDWDVFELLLASQVLQNITLLLPERVRRTPSCYSIW